MPIEQKNDIDSKYDLDFSKAERGRGAKRIKREGSPALLVESDLLKSLAQSQDASFEEKP